MAKKDIQMAVCLVCGKRFKQYRSYHKYCSDKCRSKIINNLYQSKLKEEEDRECPNCGKVFKTNKSHQKFCSEFCYLAHRETYYIKQEPHIIKCAWCDKKIKTTHGIKKYCSKDCYDEAAKARREHIKEIRNGRV